MENSSTKTCRICYGEIDARAKKCPLCQHWQNRLTAAYRHPIVASILLLFLIPIILYLFRPPFEPGKDFNSYRKKVRIAYSKMTSGQTECGPTMVVLGSFKNETDVPWKDLQLEVTFFNRSGTLVDTVQKNENSFILEAKSDIPFKISMRREFRADNYASHKVRILTAKDARALF